MIYLYYTGAIAFNKPQPDAYKSLGGYISGTVIPNSRLNTLFNNGSLSSKNDDNKNETICIAVKNIANADLKNFSMYCDFDPLNPDYTIEAAIVSPTLDNCNALSFERLSSNRELPYYGEFNDITTKEHKINIGTFAKNTYIGIFLCKKFIGDPDQCKAVDFQSQKSTDNTEEVLFNFSWD